MFKTIITFRITTMLGEFQPDELFSEFVEYVDLPFKLDYKDRITHDDVVYVIHDVMYDMKEKRLKILAVHRRTYPI